MTGLEERAHVLGVALENDGFKTHVVGNRVHVHLPGVIGGRRDVLITLVALDDPVYAWRVIADQVFAPGNDYMLTRVGYHGRARDGEVGAVMTRALACVTHTLLSEVAIDFSGLVL